MENDNNPKNLAKLAKLQKQIKTDQEKLKHTSRSWHLQRKKLRGNMPIFQLGMMMADLFDIQVERENLQK